MDVMMDSDIIASVCPLIALIVKIVYTRFYVVQTKILSPTSRVLSSRVSILYRHHSNTQTLENHTQDIQIFLSWIP